MGRLINTLPGSNKLALLNLKQCTKVRWQHLDNVYQWFGLPSKLISDCDTHFTSYFGKVLAQKLGITQNLSMAFHPQTDGLSERKNQWVEQYLCLINSDHEWATIQLGQLADDHNGGTQQAV